MIIGVPKEIMPAEARVALTPAGAEVLRQAGHRVLIETDAGTISGFSDASFTAVGAVIVADKRQLFDTAEMIMKVKEPLAEEFDLFHAGQVLFTFLHLASKPELTRALLARGVVGIAYETIEAPDRSLPLLTPMSEIAGRLAVQVGAAFLQRPHGGKGTLLGGIPGVEPAQVVVLGGGVVGTNAAKMAVGTGARVTVLDRSAQRLAYLDDLFDSRVTTIMSNSYSIASWVQRADLFISGVLVPGARAPKLVTEAMVRTMEPGSVIVDVAVDQGAAVETIDHGTTHDDPVYLKYGVVHYAVANMPGAVPRTSTLALTNATLEYALLLANEGWRQAARLHPGLARGLNTAAGHILYPAVADAHGLTAVPLEDVLEG